MSTTTFSKNVSEIFQSSATHNSILLSRKAERIQGTGLIFSRKNCWEIFAFPRQGDAFVYVCAFFCPGVIEQGAFTTAAQYL